MLKIKNGNPDKDQKVKLDFAGWIALASFILGVIGFIITAGFFIERAVSNDKRTFEDIELIKKVKLDEYRYERDRKEQNLIDSIRTKENNRILRKIAKKLGIENIED